MPARRDRMPPPGAARSGAESALVGRDEELTLLRAVLAEAAGGRPGFVRMVAPPGTGATRLATEVLAEAASSGFTILDVRATPVDREVPYRGLSRAVSALLRDMPPEARASVTHGLGTLAPMVPDIGIAAPAPLTDPQLEGARILDAFGRLLFRLATREPLAVLIDDAPLLSRQSMRLLEYASASLSDRPILVIATAHPGDDLIDLDVVAGALHREGWLVTECTPAPLDDEASGSILDASAGHRLPDGRRRQAIAHCAGRPLLLAAIGRDLGAHPASADDGPLPLPPDVHAPLRARLAALDPLSTTLVDALAIGGLLGVDALAQACDRERTALADGLGVLEEAGMVRRADPGVWTLAHGVLRDVALAALPAARAEALHARLALALRTPDASAAAAHALAGIGFLDPDEAAALILTEAERLHGIGALTGATRLLESTAAHAGRMRAGTRARLHALRARCLHENGDDDAADAAWDAAASAFDEDADPVGRAAADRERAEVDWARGDTVSALARLRTAEVRLAGLEPTDALAAILHARAVNALRLHDLHEVEVVAGRLDAVAERLGSRTAAARSTLVRAAALMTQTDFVPAEQLCLRALADAEASGDELLIMRARDQLSVIAATEGDIDALIEHSRACLRLAHEVPLMEGWAIGRIAMADLMRGRLDEALQRTAQLVETALRAQERRIVVSALSMHALALAHAGRVSAARTAVDRARRESTIAVDADHHISATVELADLAVALAEGRPEDATGRVHLLDDPTAGWLPLVGMSLLGHAYARTGQRARIPELVARVRGIRSCRTIMPAAVGAWLQGLAAATDPDASADPRRALRLLDEAADAFSTLDLVVLAATARLEAATTRGLAAAESAERLRAAAGAFDRAHAPIGAFRARQLLAQLGMTPEPAPAPRPPALSSRELEVAQLVAGGLTNVQIADRLSISPRTVSTHLDHVYRRFGFRSRVGLARYVLDSGLADASTGNDGNGT